MMLRTNVFLGGRLLAKWNKGSYAGRKVAAQKIMFSAKTKQAEQSIAEANKNTQFIAKANTDKRSFMRANKNKPSIAKTNKNKQSTTKASKNIQSIIKAKKDRESAAESKDKKVSAAADKSAILTKALQRQREDAAEKLFLRRIEEARSQRQRIIKAAMRRAASASAAEDREEVKALRLYEANKKRAVAELERLKRDSKVATDASDAAGETATKVSSLGQGVSKSPKKLKQAESASDIAARKEKERLAERKFNDFLEDMKAQREAEILALQRAEESDARKEEERHFNETETESIKGRSKEFTAAQELKNLTSFSTKMVDEEAFPARLESDVLLTSTDVESTNISGGQEAEWIGKPQDSARRRAKEAGRARPAAAASLAESAPSASVSAAAAARPPKPPPEIPFAPFAAAPAAYHSAAMAPAAPAAYHSAAMAPAAVHALPLAGFGDPPLVSQFRAPSEVPQQWRAMGWPTSVSAPVVPLHPQAMQTHHPSLGRFQAAPSVFPRGASVAQQNRERQNNGSGLFRV